jgi:chaperone BCS1
MLTVLDGLVEMRGRVMIACTNHPERIDSALLRPGRFDMVIHMGKFNDFETKQLLLRHAKTEEEKELIRSTTFKHEAYSPTEILNLLARKRKQGMIQVVKELVT